MPPTRFRLHSLSFVVMATVILALGFQAWMLREGYHRAVGLYATRAANRAQATAHAVQGVIEQVDLLLLGIREQLDPEEIARGARAVPAARIESMRQRLQAEAAKVPRILLLHVVSPDGRYVFSSNPALPAVSVADRRYFQEQRSAARDELRLSEPLFGRVSQRWAIFPSRRLVTRDGRFAGIVMAVLDAETLGSAMVAVDKQQWILALFDQEQRLVARSPLGGGVIGTPMGDARLAQVWQAMSFVGKGLGETTDHIWAIQPLDRLPLFTCAGFAKSRALAQWRSDLLIHLSVAALLVLGCITVLALQHRNQQSLESIHALNERMKLAATAVGLGIWEWEPATGLLDWDAGMMALHALPPRSFLGHESHWLSRIHEEDRNRILEARSRALAGDPFHVRFRVTDAGGQDRHLEAAAALRVGEQTRLVGVAWDVTDEEMAQRELRTSEVYFRRLFNEVPDAVAILRGGRVVDANQRYRELFRIPEHVETPPWELAPGQQPNGATSKIRGESLSALALAGQVQRVHWQYQRSDGSGFDGDLLLTHFRHEAQDLLIAIIRDLTDMRVMEEKLHQAQKLDAIGQLAGGIAHDFNNMLSAILCSSDLLVENLHDERQKLLARTILSAAERASQLTRKLLAFARKGKILSTAMDVHQLLQEAVALLERTIDRKILIETRLSAEHATVVGDPSQIQNALLNLGVNARDAMPNGGRITYATELVELSGPQCRQGSFTLEPGTFLHVSVADEGCGIPEDLLNKIFDPFFTTKEVDKGTGLGLASVFGTMVSHRGAVAVESRVGAGSVFHLFLPVQAPDLAALPKAATPAQVPRGSGRILVIDDEEIVQTATAMLLGSLGYQALVESDAEKAILFFRDHHLEIAAVLVDMVMPKISGAEVAAYLRSIDPDVPVILASGFPRNAEVNQLIGHGAVAFLQKPFNRHELAELLDRVIRASS